MWLPRGVDQFFEAALARLAEIKETLKDQERATRDAYEAPSADKGEKPGVIARIAAAFEANNADVESYEKPQRAKEYGRQWWFLFWSGATAIFTAFAFGAAGIYACIANQQLGKMEATYKETQRQTYYNCLNTQATQKTFLQIQNAAADSHAAAAAAVTQAAAEIEINKAVINFIPRLPEKGEFLGNNTTDETNPGNNLGIPFSIKNDGKDPAEFTITFRGVLLRHGDKLSITYPRDKINTLKTRLQGGGIFPEKAEPGSQFHPLTWFVPVVNIHGDQVPYNSVDAKDFRLGEDDVMVFAKLDYKDGWGEYHTRFCARMYIVLPGVSGGKMSRNARECANYNLNETHYTNRPEIKPMRTLPEINPVNCTPPPSN
jgi:hypothetical protein